ncbi:MAG: hypothetical protein KUG76_07440 [Gammaproteobacteria bacterium]|nr:hypothetical protein [Gammaproteobacteria bacterium]
MNLPGTPQISGGISKSPLSRKKSSSAARRKPVDTNQAIDNSDEKLSVFEETDFVSFVEKEISFKEELAGNVFQKQLSDHLNRKVGQLFDGIREEIESTNRRLGHAASMYIPNTLSFEQKISSTSFFYLSRINHAITAIAYQSGLIFALHETTRVREAINEGFSSSLSEISGMGILNDEMKADFSKARHTMESGLISNVVKLLIVDLDKSVVQPTIDAAKGLAERYQLADLDFTTLLFEKYTKQAFGKPKHSPSKSIQSAIEGGDASVFNIQPHKGPSVELYLANENKLPSIEHWFECSGNNFTLLSVQKNRHVKLSACLHGDLDQGEIDAIEILLQRFVLLSDVYYVSRVAKAFSIAVSNGYNGEELVAYLLDGHRKLYRKNINIYHDVATSVNRKRADDSFRELPQLEVFVQNLYQLMVFCRELGIQESDQFVIDILDTLTSYDDRQNFEFFRSQFSGRFVTDHLVMGINEAGGF